MTSQTFPLTFHDGHPIARIGGRSFFLDTGCPGSLGEGGAVELLGRRFPLRGPQGFGGFTLEAVRRLAGPVDGLLGMDVLRAFRVAFDAAAGTLTLDTEPSADPRGALPVRLLPGGNAPVLEGVHRGRTVQVVFDTGAWLSYLVGVPPADLPVLREARDENPQIGAFTTEVREDDLALGGRTLRVPFGRLPAAGEVHLILMGVDWVVGLDLLQAGRVVLDVPRGRVELGG